MRPPVPARIYSPLPVRAQALLQWIGEGGLASRTQLARRFWPQARPTTPYHYLRDLVHAGYLQAGRQTVLGAPQDLYVLTGAASRALDLAPPLVRVGWPPPGEWAHLLLGQEVRLWLEAHLAQAGQGGTIRAWHTDYYLRHLVPPGGALADIAVAWCPSATSPPQPLLIEVDGAYFGARLAAKLVAYGAQPTPVLWVCRPARAARLRRAAAPYPQIAILPLDLPTAGGTTP
jgi:hypothetical protein